MWAVQRGRRSRKATAIADRCGVDGAVNPKHLQIAPSEVRVSNFSESLGPAASSTLVRAKRTGFTAEDWAIHVRGA